jgi:hypothetical protein
MILLIHNKKNIILERLDIMSKTLAPDDLPQDGHVYYIDNAKNTCTCFGERHVYCLLVKTLIDYSFDPEEIRFSFRGNNLNELIRYANIWCELDANQETDDENPPRLKIVLF